MRLHTWICLIFALFLFTEGLFGQEYRGSLSGRVLDPSAAAVPGAHVTLTNTATNVRLTTDTNADGHYTVPFLQPGTYSLRAEHQGFKAFERSPIEVRIEEAVTVDAQLQLGSAAETVNVQAETPLLDVASASLGETVDAKRVVELPIQQGVPYHLIALTPGVVKTGTNMLDENPYDGTIISYSVGGESASSNLITVDGAITGQVSGGNGPSFSPPEYSVGEFRVLTSSFSAEQGFTQGAQVSVSLKSGTNTLHGGLADYGGGNGSLIANQYLAAVGGRPKAPSGPYRRRELGVGGPVYIPKVYDGRNKTFWFFGFTNLDRTQVLTQYFTVPTLPQRKGDFSALLPLGSSYQIYDPYSWKSNGNGTYTSTPLPNNIIPASILNQTPASKVGMGFLQFWPLPNNVGGPTYSANGTNDFYCNQSGQSNQYWGMDLRLDHNFSNRNRFYASMHRFDRNNQDYNIFQNAVSGDSWKIHPRGGVIDDVEVIGPSLVMDVRLGFDDYDKLVTSLGSIPLTWRYATYAQGVAGFAQLDGYIDPSIERMPSISPAGYTGAPPGANLTWNQSYTYEPSVHFTKTHGPHTMNFGWDLLVRRDNAYLPGLGATGSFNFNGAYMVGPLNTAATAPTGQGLAQMEYGLPFSTSINVVPSSASQSLSHAFYFQEDWRVSRKLTLNLGLRYEYWGPTSERYNRSTQGWNPTATHSYAAAVEAAYLQNPTPEVSALNLVGGLTVAGSANGGSHGLWQANHDFMPRFGLSYALDTKTVLHSGYGIFFGAMGDLFQAVNQTGFSRTTTYNGTLNNGLDGYPYSLANPFPAPPLPALGAGLGADTNVGNSLTVVLPHPKDLYVQRWTLGIQRELPARIVLSISYTGDRGVHLTTSKNLDALPNQYLSILPTRDNTTINYLGAQVPNPFKGLVPAGTSLNTNSTIARSSLLTPYPLFTGVTYNTQQGYNMYNSLQVHAERRFANGFTGTFVFTWQNDMEATSFLNAGDPVPEKLPATTDFPVYFSASGIYSLPIGRGRMLLGNSSKIVNALLGGWQIEGVYRYQSGPPLGFGDALLNGSCPTLASIALPADQRSYLKWFNTSCFNTVSSQQLANNLITLPARFSYIRGMPLSVADLSGIKKFKISERVNVEMRWEFLNAFNHVWLGAPNTSPTSGAFGQSGTEQSSPRRVYWSGHITF
jgi:hypothetical protein